MYEEKLGKVAKGQQPRLRAKRREEMQAIEYYTAHYQQLGYFPLFTQVQIETRTDCNRRCIFCPQGHTQRPLKIMDWKVYEKIIGDLKTIGFAGRIALFMTNEPLLEERIVEMVTYARQASPRFFIDINSNGNKLDVPMADALFAAGLDNLNIEDYRSDRDKNPMKMSKNIEQVAHAYRGNPKLSIHGRGTKEVLTNRAGSVPKQGTEETHATSFCNFPFRKMSISPYGQVVLCCMDYHFKTDFGNVMDASLAELWNGPDLNAYRVMLLQRNRERFCKGCDEYQY